MAADTKEPFSSSSEKPPLNDAAGAPEGTMEDVDIKTAAEVQEITGWKDDYKRQPTEQERQTLRRVPAKVPWATYSVAFVEFCERFSYSGTTVVFVNFIQRSRPIGSRTGAGGWYGTSGALGQGQQTSTALTLFNSFWAYITPSLGAFVADEYLGRFNTIMYAIAFSIIGHILLIISALPTVLDHSNGALACFVLGVVILGLGTGGFKSNVSVLIAEQSTETHMYVSTTDDGEQVIVDPSLTATRIYHYYYMMINFGGMFGGIGMVFAEKYIGYWLAYLLPTAMYALCPLVLLAFRKQYVRTKPAGSVYGKAFKLLRLVMKGRFSWNPVRTYRNFQDPNLWEKAKPSKLAVKPSFMTWDDAWVDEVRRGVVACKIFLWFPLYWLSYNQFTNNMTSQAATMTLHGVPNDMINNLGCVAIIIIVPIVDKGLYPWLRKHRILLTPIRRITLGFYVACIAQIIATVIQYYIYKTGPCGWYANTCAEQDRPAPLNVWIQSPCYVIAGTSEIFASITSLEYAYTKAPTNMRSIIQGIALFTMAVASAVGQALVPLANDPNLIWNYMVTAILAFVGGTGFWFCNRGTDREEDQLNNIEVSEYNEKDRGHQADGEAVSEKTQS
ncbi:hypothetical protein KEM52_006104 [Ascosphaera acerosa]|nr:hypothetical protein KEM52_006104 [Ascosphaera acerosa]